MNLQRPPTLAAWLIATAVACTVAPVHAQSDAAATSGGGQSTAAPADSAAPAADPDTLILSDTLNYDDIKKESVFTGNVIMTRGLMTLRSDKLVMSEDAEGFQYGTATVTPGKLVHIRQENPEKFEVIEAEGVRGEYDGKKEELVMIGKAVLTRYVCGKPFDNVKGERVVYKQKTETYEAYGGPDSAAAGGRVRSLASPRAKADAAAAECKKKSAGSAAPSKARQ
jgi:lipopolysaccharide export system protein LptA